MLNPFSVVITVNACLILTACIVYFLRTRSALSVALLVGGFGPLISASQGWLLQWFVPVSALRVPAVSLLLGIFSIAGVLLSVCFAVSLLLVMLKQPRERQTAAGVSAPVQHAHPADSAPAK